MSSVKEQILKKINEEKKRKELEAQNIFLNIVAVRCSIFSMTHLYIPIKPQAKQSTRFTKKKGKQWQYTDKKKKEYVEFIENYVKKWYNGKVLKGLVRISIIYSFPFRKLDKKVSEKRDFIMMDQRPDVGDNLNKPVLDALSGVCFEDDSQIVEIQARKIRSNQTGILVRLEEIRC